MSSFTQKDMNAIKDLLDLGFTPDQIVAMRKQTAFVVSNGGKEISVATEDMLPARAVDDGDETGMEYVQRDTNKLAALDAKCKEFFAEMLEPRHMEIFTWLCSGRDRASDVSKALIRNAVIQHRPSWREAMGQGGGSSKNLEVLADRLTPVKVKD